MTSTRTLIRKLSVLALLLAYTAQVFATQQYSPSYGYSVDFPEGFYLSAKNDEGTAYQFSSALLPVEAVLRIYDADRYPNAQDALDKTLDALGADGASESFNWRGTEAAIATFTLKLNPPKNECEGLGIATPLTYGAGTLVLFTWCEKAQYENCLNYMLSLLDSVSIDRGSYFEQGPVTTYAYPQGEEDVSVTLDINGTKVQTTLNSSDEEAARYLIEREYDVLCLYQSSVLWKEAWQRYYRMIFRDSYGRLENAAFDIYNAISASCTDETDLAQQLLTWTQEMNYEREKTDSDFASLPSILLGSGSDCDSRSMLLAVLLRHMNVDTVIFVSAEYSHAIAGMVSSHPGHSYTVNGKKYLMGETTAKGLTWGKVAQDQDDESKWIAVEPPLPYGD
ncbi:MAG: hypothetical protein IIT68_01350 [Treponema sp.]|nr:hypothetical protein [Treponema sp.]